VQQEEEQYGIHYIDLGLRSKNFYECSPNRKIRDCIKYCFKDDYCYYFPGGCYLLDEEKSWMNYEHFYTERYNENRNLLGIRIIPKKKNP